MSAGNERPTNDSPSGREHQPAKEYPSERESISERESLSERECEIFLLPTMAGMSTHFAPPDDGDNTNPWDTLLAAVLRSGPVDEAIEETKVVQLSDYRVGSPDNNPLAADG